jgi:hypothetical protein
VPFPMRLASQANSMQNIDLGPAEDLVVREPSSSPWRLLGRRAPRT